MKTHWKKLQNPDYLGAWDFQPNEIKTLTIKLVKMEKVTGSGGKKEDCAVCHFQEQTKPMILNVTNSKAIEKRTQSAYIEDWAGCKIAVRTEKVNAFGDMVDAVRVCDIPELTPNHPKWNGAVNSLKNGEVTIEQIKKRFIISPENEAILCATKSI